MFNIYEKEIETKVKELPEQLKEKVLNYVNYLIAQQESKSTQPKPFIFEWEGAIKDVENNIDSVTLQHKSLDWR